jgi:hypothetical protein
MIAALPLEVRADCAVREVQALADLAVGQDFGGELRDLQLLGGELVPGGGIAPWLDPPEARSSRRACSLQLAQPGSVEVFSGR